MSKNQKVHKQAENYFVRALVDSASIIETESEKSFEVVFATENPVFRRGWEENFNEVLAIDPANMRMERMQAGAVPLMDNHDTYTGVTKQMGTVTSFSINKGEARAKILFSTQDRFADIWKDIKAGIIRSISTGYRVYKYLREVVSDNSVPNYRAIDWEPMEISLAPVPADFKSKIRSEENSYETIIENLSPVKNNRSKMEGQDPEVVGTTTTTQRSSTTTSTATVEAPANADQIRSEARKEEKQRHKDIFTAVRNAGLDEAFASELVEKDVTIDSARAAIIDKIAEKNAGNTPNVRTATASTASVTGDEGVKVRKAMSDGLMHRALPGSVKLEDQAHDFKYMSMIDLGRHCLTLNGENANRYSPSEVIKRAISTTDYPLLLSSTVERSIRRVYDSIPADWKNIAKQKTAKDFREVTGIAVDKNVTFEEIAEGGEYKNSILTTVDSAKLKLKTYGRMIKITRNTIINDDLAVFDQLPSLLAFGAANFQADKVWGLITNNAKTPDGKAMFHADHNNLATGADKTAPTEALLSKIRTAMYRQKSPAGNSMPSVPKWLIVPMELMQAAEKLLSSPIATAANDVNTWAGKLQPMTNQRLINPSEWYVAGDLQSLEGLVYAYLLGEEGLHVENEVNFNDDTVTTKGRVDFDAQSWDYRPWFKNPGA